MRGGGRAAVAWCLEASGPALLSDQSNKEQDETGCLLYYKYGEFYHIMVGCYPLQRNIFFADDEQMKAFLCHVCAVYMIGKT